MKPSALRFSTIKKSWRPVKVNGEEFLIATDGKTINFKDGSSIVLTKVNDNAELTISINNKANEDDKNENDTDSEAFQFLNYNTELRKLQIFYIIAFAGKACRPVQSRLPKPGGKDKEMTGDSNSFRCNNFPPGRSRRMLMRFL